MEKHPVSAAEPGLRGGRRGEGVRLFPTQVVNRTAICSLGRNRQDTLDQATASGFSEGQEAKERVDRRQANIATRNGVSTYVLKVAKELAHTWGVQIHDLERRRGFSQALLQELEKQAEGVPIARDGVLAGSLLLQEPFDEERLQMSCQPCAHGL